VAAQAAAQLTPLTARLTPPEQRRLTTLLTSLLQPVDL
jgi:hypothetical protein